MNELSWMTVTPAPDCGHHWSTSSFPATVGGGRARKPPSGRVTSPRGCGFVDQPAAAPELSFIPSTPK